MTRRLMWVAFWIAVTAVIVAVLPLLVALILAWHRAFADRRRSSLPEWIGAAALVWIAARSDRGVRRGATGGDLRA